MALFLYCARQANIFVSNMLRLYDIILTQRTDGTFVYFNEKTEYKTEYGSVVYTIQSTHIFF